MMQSVEILNRRTSAQSLCYYRNSTSTLQVAAVHQGGSVILERVIFPGEGWLFEAYPDAELQIHTKAAGGYLSSVTTCDRHQVRAK